MIVRIVLLLVSIPLLAQESPRQGRFIAERKLGGE